MVTDDDATLTDPARLDAVRWIARDSSGLERSFDRTTRLLAALTEAPIAAFSLVEEDHQLIQSSFGLEVTETSEEEGVFCRTCVVSGDILIVEDALADERFRDTRLVSGEPGLRFYAGLPVRSPNGHAVGTLCIVDLEPRTPDERLIGILRDLRDDLEELLVLRTMSIFDSLTGLYNRRYFDDLLAREIGRSRRDGADLALMVIDLDDFKGYNDLLGHHAGDRALKAFAGVLGGCFRRGGEVAARYGGEEFVALVAGAGPEEAVAHAERLREMLAGADLPHPGSPTGGLNVSVGLAVAEAQGTPQTPEQLFQRADAALYEAKRAGRDRVVIASASAA